MSRWNNKIVIFDLDGTIADISVRRHLATKDDGRMNWTIFQDPKNIDLDVPNQKVVEMLDMIDNTDKYQIWILSGRSDVTKDVTINWLSNHGINYDHLIMRDQDNLYMPDNDLKQTWLNDIGVDNVAMVFDDRNQVVDMWRQNSLTCFQVADGDF